MNSESPKDISIFASQYYIHNRFVNTYYHVYKFLENWISKNIFRNDSSRIFLSSDERCFKRRFELTDTSEDYSSLEFSSLRFPFANYYPHNTGWQPDPRIAAKSAAMTYIGIYEGNTKLKASQSLMNIPVTFWFDREDDARLAYEILYFKSFNEHYYSVKVPYGRDFTLKDNNGYSSTSLHIPMNLLIEDLKFNPELKDTDWLKKQRLFTIKTDFRIRSYAILPPEQPNYDVTMNEDGTLSDGSFYNDGYNYYYIVDDVITNLGNKKIKTLTFDAGYNDVDGSYKGTTPFPSKGESNTIYVDSYVSESERYSMKPVNIYVWDSLNERYVLPDYQLPNQSVRYYEKYEESSINIDKFDCISKVTPHSNLLSWEYGEGTTIDDIESIELHVTPIADFISISSDSKSYKMEGLKSSCQYYGYIVFTNKKGQSKNLIVNFTTPPTKKEEENKKEDLDSLIGIKF